MIEIFLHWKLEEIVGQKRFWGFARVLTGCDNQPKIDSMFKEKCCPRLTGTSEVWCAMSLNLTISFSGDIWKNYSKNASHPNKAKAGDYWRNKRSFISSFYGVIYLKLLKFTFCIKQFLYEFLYEMQ